MPSHLTLKLAKRCETSTGDFEEQGNLKQILENKGSAGKLWISEHNFNFQKEK